MSAITNIEDLRRLAQARVPRMFYDYADSGSWTEQTYRANTTDFEKIRLRQRVAVNMDGRKLATTLAGSPAAMPVAIAPTGLTGMQHADGEIHAARAAEKFGIPFTLSTLGTTSIEAVKAANPEGRNWFQLYVMRQREISYGLVERAAGGFGEQTHGAGVGDRASTGSARTGFSASARTVVDGRMRTNHRSR
jgi:isopentenyl diphosphate isomerase/L-lactate dehydrogenase-like FMN-dependent dehydrogenase